MAILRILFSIMLAQTLLFFSKCKPASSAAAATSLVVEENASLADSTCLSFAAKRGRPKAWLITDLNKSGLCNQLMSIFSFFPIAKLLGADIVLDHMYSRESFEDHWPFSPSKWSPHSFSLFFDLAHLKSFWRDQSEEEGDELKIIDRSELDLCRQQQSQAGDVLFSKQWQQQVVIIRRDVFSAQNDKQVLAMVQRSGVKVNELLGNAAVKIQSSNGVNYMKLYSFWDNPSYLMKVHRSLQPSPILETYIQAILRGLPKNFIAVHMRVEADYWGHDEKRVLPELLAAAKWVDKHVKQSSCFLLGSNGTAASDSHSSSHHTMPVLYLSSALFGNANKNASSSSKIQQEHAAITLRHLRDLGLHTAKITWRQKVLDDKASNALQDHRLYSSSRHQQYHNHPSYHRPRHHPLNRLLLLPEQLALVDMEVARRAACFVPSHIGSSFSYMITRRRDLDQGKILTFAQVHQVPEEMGGHGVSHDFKDWGI